MRGKMRLPSGARAIGFRRPDAMRADFSLSFAHDFETGDVGRLVLDGRISPRSWLGADLDLGWDAESRALEEALVNLRVRLPDAAGFDHNRLQLRYRYLRELPLLVEDDVDRIDQVGVRLDTRLLRRLDVGYGFTHSIEARRTLRHGGRLLYASGCHCWSAGVELGDDRTRGVYYRLIVNLFGLGDLPGPDRNRGLALRSRR